MTSDQRTCIECKQDLTPNYMEGCWEHFAKGCKFSGKQTFPLKGPPYTSPEDFAGPRRSELEAAMTAQGKPDRCPRCGSDAPEVTLCFAEYPCSFNHSNCTDWWHYSSPVPAAAPQQLGTCPELRTPHAKGDECGNWTPIVSAPQAESVPSGKDAAAFAKEYKGDWNAPFRENAAREWLKSKGISDQIYLTSEWLQITDLMADYAASQTAALREQLKSACTQLATHHDLKHDALDKLEAAERSNSLLRERLNAAIRLFGEIETIDQPYLVFERDFWKRITDFAAHKENQ